MTIRARLIPCLKLAVLSPLLAIVLSMSASAQQDLPWKNGQNTQDQYGASNGRSYSDPGQRYDPSQHGSSTQYKNDRRSGYQQGSGQGADQGGYDSGYDALRNNNRPSDNYGNRRPNSNQGYDNKGGDQAPRQYDDQRQARQPDYTRQPSSPRQGYQPPANTGPGQAYAPPAASGEKYARPNQRPSRTPELDDTYSDHEILNAGHHFFGKVTKGLAKAVAHVFSRSGRPNAYILGEEGSGAWVIGARYGEGTVYTKRGERRPIYWQGPSIGYDVGAEGAKTMVLVYHLRNLNKLYARFAGVDGSAYLVGGVGVTFQKRGRVVLALIRSGVGVRLGANIGYLKYTRSPTWNPF